MLKEALQLVNPEIQVIDKSLSGHCHITKTCATDLRVFNRDNAYFMHGNMEHHRQLFWESYRGDTVMRTVDAFFCSLPCALCEAFMPFNKSLLVMFPTRYEAGRLSPPEWQKWNQNLLKIATSPKNILVANNLYDAEYVKYFTGLKDILVFESYSGYTNAEYKGTDNRILIGPGRLTVVCCVYGWPCLHCKQDPKTFFTELHSLAKQKELKYTFHPLREIYGSYGFQDLANHVAILNIPYQVSVMSFFEMYRMNIPLLFPTRKLLAEWVIKYKMYMQTFFQLFPNTNSNTLIASSHGYNRMNERTWEGVFNRPKQSSLIPKHPSVNIPYDPNNEVDKERKCFKWVLLFFFAYSPLAFIEMFIWFSLLHSSDFHCCDNSVILILVFVIADIEYWLQFSDFYQWPHIILFDSWEDLVNKVQHTNFAEISQRMRVYNAKKKIHLIRKWKLALYRMFKDGTQNGPDVRDATQATNMLYK